MGNTYLLLYIFPLSTVTLRNQNVDINPAHAEFFTDKGKSLFFVFRHGDSYDW